jgi:FixJ family two-component response regulator
MDSARNILVAVVDDDESLCRSLGRLLRAYGLQPKAYSSAEMFLADADRPNFDCLILDVQLGGLSGLDLQEQLARDGNAPPVIFITAHEDPEARRRAQTLGCAAYFRKTEPGSSVIEAVRNAAVGHLGKPLA